MHGFDCNDSILTDTVITVGRPKASHFLLCARAEGRFDFERPPTARAEGPLFFGVFLFCTRVRVLMAFHLRH